MASAKLASAEDIMDSYDHRVLGPKLGLFHQQEEASGTAFWHPQGATLYRTIENCIRNEMQRAGFQEVRTPQLLSRTLWERSGHWAKYQQNMFAFEDEGRSLALKPMNCPGHVQIFRSEVRSYRDLPIRLSEFGVCHRYEASGALHGLMRARAFTQDDAHVFCLPEHVHFEVARFNQLLQRVYYRFGFAECLVGFSTRPAAREGSDDSWDRAEALLASAAEAAGLAFRVQPGDGAFYGPKLEFILKDRYGREWQCGTIQLDMVLPEKLDAAVVDSAGNRTQPVMLHHAVLGSIERFTAILLEHHRGALPLWLAPVQVQVCPIADAHLDYARRVVDTVSSEGIRCVMAPPSETLSRRVFDAHERCIPIVCVVGDKEAAKYAVSLRLRHGERLSMELERLAQWLSDRCAESGARM
jgi:threonyl-tRNA synthetase